MKPTKLLLLLALLWPATFAAAQNGKISGTVTESATGDALPGVNVVIEGTTTGTTTGVDGFFSILNVRPGTYTLRATFIGFTPSVIENVRVGIDLTTTVDIELREEAVGLDEIIVSAERPIIQRDISASQRNFDAEEIRNGRYQNLEQVLSAQSSSTNLSSYDDLPRLRTGSSSSRGTQIARFSEVIVIVDGVNQGDPLTYQPNFKINLDAIEEVKVQTGGFSAEYGNVRSGVINVVTREGSERYSGSFNVSYSPSGLKHFGPGIFDFDSPIVQPFVNRDVGAFEGGNSFFDGWNTIAADLAEGVAHAGQPMELYARYLWRHRSQDAINELKNLAEQGIVTFPDGVNPDDMVWHQTGVDPDYRISATLGGPLPMLNAVKFFLSYDGTQSEYAYRFPERSFVDNNLRAKLTANVGRGMKLNLHGLYSKQKGGDGGQGPGIGGFISSNPFTATGSENKYWYPHCGVPGNRTRQLYGAQWTHAISANTFYQMNLTHDRVDYEMEMQFRNTAPIPGSDRGDGSGLGIPSSSPTSGSGIDQGRIGTTAEAETRAAAGQQGWENWRDWAMIQIGQHWYDEAPKGYGPVNWRDITGEYRMESCNLRADETYTRGWNLSGGLTSQLDRHNQVKVGFEIRRDDINQYYEAIDPSVNSGSIWDSNVDQMRGGAYLQDKLEFEGFVANLGVRLDFLVTGEFPSVLDDCDLTNASACLGDTGPFSQFLAGGNTTADVEGGRVLDIKETIIGDNIGTSRKTHVRISPRIGISHPITTVAKVFFNYGHFYQWPTPIDLYELRLDTRRGYQLVDLGNPMVEPERTIQYEIGYEQNLFDRMNLRLTGYFKDINNEIAQVDMYPLSYGGRNYDMAFNQRFRDIRGFETFLELRRGVVPHFSGWISGNYLVESGAEYGFDRFYEDPSRQARLAGTEVSNPDVRPILKANVNFSTPDDFAGPRLGDISLLGGINVNLLYTWQRGPQMTWNPAEFPLVEDNIRWRPYQRWDLRLTKSLFRSGTYETVFYIDVSNLFNNRNMTVFSGQNDANITDENWAWDGHRWWRTERRDYLESLGYSAENQNPDGTFNNTIGKPGTWKDGAIDLPAFTPWTFLEQRDIYFGVRFYF